MDNASVLEFVCAGFTAAGAPPLCSGDGVLAAPCRAGAPGDASCAARAAADGRTRCLADAAYPYFRCACPLGTTPVGLASDGSAGCAPVHACDDAAARLPSVCGCPTCLCRASPEDGQPVCSNVTDDPCASPGAGGCWVGGGALSGLSACVFDLSRQRAAARLGLDPAGYPSTRCACPPPTAGDGYGCAAPDACAARTPGYTYDAAGVCVKVRGGGGGGDLGGGAIFAIVVATLAGFGGACYALWRWVLSRRLHDAVRSIVGHYMPLGAVHEVDEAGEFKARAPGSLAVVGGVWGVAGRTDFPGFTPASPPPRPLPPAPLPAPERRPR